MNSCSLVSKVEGEGCGALQEKMLEQMQVFNVGEDCPVFSQMFQFCQVRLPVHVVMLGCWHHEHEDMSLHAGSL